MVHSTDIKVRYAETDQMGIVHHSNHFVWFEAGRTELMNSIGSSYAEMEKMGYMLPVIECHCSFKSGARYEEELSVQTTIEKIEGARIFFRYVVVSKQDGRIISEGYTVHAFTDKNLKPVNLRKKCPEIYQLLEKSVSACQGH